MTREIKFRFWNGEKMDYRPELHADNLNDQFTPDMEDDGTWGYMQYTGLKDKNGKEIYEGDIIRFKTFGGNEMVYAVRWKEESAKFYPTRMTDRNTLEMKVIGNIYENPELIANPAKE